MPLAPRPLRTLLAALVLLMSIHGIAQAVDQATEQRIRAALPDLKIDTIREMPEVPGIFELVVGSKLAYCDQTGRYLFLGRIVDTQEKIDITSRRGEEIKRVAWMTVPLDAAIDRGPKDAPEVALLTDPDCPHCKALEQELVKAKQVRVHILLRPIEQIHPEAPEHARAIWCAPNPLKAFEDWMLLGKNPPAPRPGCTAPIDKVVAFADSQEIMGTPTLIAPDGRIHAGHFTVEELMKWLADK